MGCCLPDSVSACLKSPGVFLPPWMGCLLASLKNKLLITLRALNQNFTTVTSMTALAQYLVVDKSLNILSQKSSVNSFHLVVKYTWVVSECSIAFNVSISSNWLSSSVCYKLAQRLTQLFTTLVIPPSTREELGHPLLPIL